MSPINPWISFAFTSDRGDNNCWEDAWRGTGQRGTVWSFYNNDYRTAIGTGSMPVCGSAAWPPCTAAVATSWK